MLFAISTTMILLFVSSLKNNSSRPKSEDVLRENNIDYYVNRDLFEIDLNNQHTNTMTIDVKVWGHILSMARKNKCKHIVILKPINFSMETFKNYRGWYDE